jgi:hypothetical protein
VTHIHHTDAAFDSDVFDSNAFQTDDGLYVTLDADEGAALGAVTMDVPTLAKIVLNLVPGRFTDRGQAHGRRQFPTTERRAKNVEWWCWRARQDSNALSK